MVGIFVPILLFFFLLFFLSWFVRSQAPARFLGEYFLADRTLKGFVLAMSLVATYGSVSSFVSGPGLAWQYGLGWVAFAAPQIITGFLVLGVLGSKLALIGRRLNAVTIMDVIAARYKSDVLAAVMALLMLSFFTAMMTGQLIGGAQIFSQATGLSYSKGLLLFSVVVLFYTTMGGFRAVAITDTACAILMLVGMGLLGLSLINEAGGYEALIGKITFIDQSEKLGLFEITSAGDLPWTLLFSSWILVGFATVALPQSAIRCMAYRRSDDLHIAMLVGTIVCGALMIGMTMMGFLARGVLPEADSFKGNTDAMIPFFISQHMSPWLAGITLIGPLAATMSTVSSLLIGASSAIVKDLFLRFEGAKPLAAGQLERRAKACTFLLGFTALLLALYPLDLIAWINLFAFGGLEVTFLCPLLGGLFWSRATKAGAWSSIVVGLGFYLTSGLLDLPLSGWHGVVPALVAAIIAFVVGSLSTKPEKDLTDFFPKN